MKQLTLAEYKDFWSRFKSLGELVEKVATARESRKCEFRGISSDGEIRYFYWDGCQCHGYECHGFLSPELLFAEDPLSIVEAEKTRRKEKKEAEEKQEKVEEEEQREEKDREEYKRLSGKYDTPK